MVMREYEEKEPTIYSGWRERYVTPEPPISDGGSTAGPVHFLGGAPSISPGGALKR